MPSFGSYLKSFNMLEDGCHILDCQLACDNSKRNNNEEFQKYIEVRKTVTDLEKDVADIQNMIALINHLIINLKVIKNENFWFCLFHSFKKIQKEYYVYTYS